ncbi:hypothetical protein V8C35DRAFT_332910 [Trichoderma chlorosporum]
MASRATSPAPSQGQPQEPSTRRATNQERDHQIMLDYASHSDGMECEMPEDGDFHGKYTKLSQKGYYMRINLLREEKRKGNEQAVPDSLMAPEPWVPDPYDDSPGEGGEMEENRVRKRHDPTFRPNKRMRVPVDMPSRRQPLSQEFIRPEDEPEDEEIPDLILRKTPPTFTCIPSEVRMRIYRYLLTVKKPIAVHGGWKQVYWTKDLQLSTAILRVCKEVHNEASMVLYGANTFLYRLRDPTVHGWQMDCMAMDDSMSSDASDSDSDYEDEDDYDDAPTVNKESSINIDRYAHLFRYITIEAEANRYSIVTQNSMVAAIRVFRKPGGGDPDEPSFRNIHTLTVRIMPLWEAQLHQPQQGRFTFVDFFLPASPVIEAIKSVDCQMLHVDVLTRHASRRSAHVTFKGSGSCRLTINRCHEQAMSYFRSNKAAGAGRDPMRRRTRVKAERSVRAIDTLAEHIEKQCNQRNFEQETVMSMDVDSLDWLEDDNHGDDADHEDDGN